MRFGRRNLSSDDLVPLTNCHRAFSKRTLKRLLGKKKEGAKGWDESAYWTYPDIIKRLRAAVKRGDMVDVSNLAMFAWNMSDGGGVA